MDDDYEWDDEDDFIPQHHRRRLPPPTIGLDHAAMSTIKDAVLGASLYATDRNVEEWVHIPSGTRSLEGPSPYLPRREYAHHSKGGTIVINWNGTIREIQVSRERAWQEFR